MIRILAVGKKHEPWIESGISRYEKRQVKPYDVKWELLPHSAKPDDEARQEESERILTRISSDDTVVLLDELGDMLDSPALSSWLDKQFTASRSLTFIIGGAYGVDDRVRQRADLVWSLSALVFPHQLVRLILVEQIYRASQITRGSSYHHQ